MKYVYILIDASKNDETTVVICRSKEKAIKKAQEVVHKIRSSFIMRVYIDLPPHVKMLKRAMGERFFVVETWEVK